MQSNTTSYSMKKLHTDNRREYIMLELQFFLWEQEIIYKTSTWHVYQQNSCAEQLNCTPLEAYLLTGESLLLLQLIYTIVYLLNISNGKHLSGKHLKRSS